MEDTSWNIYTQVTCRQNFLSWYLWSELPLLLDMERKRGKTYLEILWAATFLITACLRLAGGLGTRWEGVLWDGMILCRLTAFWMLELALVILWAPELAGTDIWLELAGGWLAKRAWRNRKQNKKTLGSISSLQLCWKCLWGDRSRFWKQRTSPGERTTNTPTITEI